jgi:hypothetical protein
MCRPSTRWQRRRSFAGAQWNTGIAELPASQCVFATDYPQAVRNDDEVSGYVDAVRNLGPEASGVLGAANASKLITNLEERYGTCQAV